MIRCCWRLGGPAPCQDAAEFVIDGHAYCEAHALHRRWLEDDRRRREWDAMIQESKDRCARWDRGQAEREARGARQAEARRWRWPWQRKTTTSPEGT